MPTYDFKCPKGHEFERFFRTISGAPSEVPCPECGQVAVRQVSGGAGLLFKGSGFYLTDYGKNAHRKERPTTDKTSDKPSDKTSEKKADQSGKAESAKSESKTESKAEPKTSKPKSE